MVLSLGPLLIGLLFSSIGAGLFIFGKNTGRLIHLLLGIALVIYPFFISNVWLMLALGSVLTAGPFLLNAPPT